MKKKEGERATGGDRPDRLMQAEVTSLKGSVLADGGGNFRRRWRERLEGFHRQTETQSQGRSTRPEVGSGRSLKGPKQQGKGKKKALFWKGLIKRLAGERGGIGELTTAEEKATITGPDTV